MHESILNLPVSDADKQADIADQDDPVNVPASEKLKKHCGVDVDDIFDEDGQVK